MILHINIHITLFSTYELHMRFSLWQDPDCAECFCGWCGKNGDLVNCRSCKNLFCSACIKKNLGEEYLLKARSSGWQCCCCSPSILQPLTLQLEKAFTSRSESSSSSDSDSDDSNNSDFGFKVPIRYSNFLFPYLTLLYNL